jgi:Domain of unknown function (DUF4384)
MFSALLLPLFIGGPAQPAAASNDDPPIRLWINNDRTFLPGDQAKVEVRTKDDGYLLVFHVDPQGHLRVLFPLDPDQDNFVQGGKKYEIRGRGGRESFEVDNGTGKGTVYAAVSRDPLHFDGFVLGDHWDYRALGPSRLSDDPEAELNDLVRRIAQTDFDYDLLNYYVSDRVAYRSDYYPSYYGSASYDPWCYSWSCGSYYGSPFNVSIGLFFGRPYRRYYYDPYYYVYDPFYNPFFYDPYYYRAVYRPRYVYPYPYHYGYGYRDRFYYDRYRPYRQPYTPYRFRGANGFTAGFRDSRGPTRWVNTVYNPPISRFRETPMTSPARRLVQPVTEAPALVQPRREVVGSPRLERRQVEARRAGEPAVQVRNRGEMETTPVTRENQGRRSVSREAGEQRRESERPTSREAWPQRVSAPEARSDRGEVDRRQAPAARPARETERVSMPESRPERREVSRPSGPSDGGGGGTRSAGEGGRRHR